MPELEISHNEKKHRFEAGSGARIDYRLRGTTAEFFHTEVPEHLQGLGLAGRMACAALDWAAKAGYKVVPSCPYIKSYIEKNPQYSKLL